MVLIWKRYDVIRLGKGPRGPYSLSYPFSQINLRANAYLPNSSQHICSLAFVYLTPTGSWVQPPSFCWNHRFNPPLPRPTFPAQAFLVSSLTLQLPSVKTPIYLSAGSPNILSFSSDSSIVFSANNHFPFSWQPMRSYFPFCHSDSLQC